MNQKAESTTTPIKANPERWQRLKNILADALEKTSVEERTAILRRACADDKTLLRQAEKLLAHDTTAFEEFAEFAARRLRPNERDRVGERIGAYAIVRELGRGGMGAVYLAERADGQFEKRVAIKVLKRGTDTDEVLRRFRIERQILANLEHPNITRLLDAGITTDGLPYFVMEFIEGTPITRFVQRENVNVRDRLKLFLKVCSAVELAHQNQIVHRDIKPTNVLVKRDGEPKLLDFGIAKLLSVDANDGDTTIAAERRLTPMYAAPEQGAGQPATIVTDVYSLGALLYELLTAHPPCSSSSGNLSQRGCAATEGIAGHALRLPHHEPKPQLASLVVTDPKMKHQLQGQLDQIVKKAMRDDPAQRYSSAADLSGDIERYLNETVSGTEHYSPASAGEVGPKDVKARTGSRSRWYIAVMGFGAIVLTAALFFSTRTKVSGLKTVETAASAAGANSPNAGTVHSIAVLPFENLSTEKENAFFADGVQEEILTDLARIADLKVIGRTSVMQYKSGVARNLRKIGQQLGVAHVLEGSVQRSGNRVRVNVELVDARTDKQLWAQTYDRDLADVFAIQSEIAERIADELQAKLSPNEKSEIERPSTSNISAFDLYIHANDFARRNPEDPRKAISFFDEAIRFDPDYALAYAHRAEVWTFIGDLSPEQKKEAWAAARKDAEKAVAVGPNLAEAHAALGWVRFFSEWKFAEGLAELQRAKELAPANATANNQLARVLVYVNQLAEAEKLARQAIELDPLAYLARGNLARILLAEGKLDAADAEARKSAELHPAAAASHRWQVVVAVLRGDGETALREAQLEPNEGYRRFELALAYYARGDRPAADAALADMVARDRNLLAYQIAEVYAWRGETDKAFEWLQISYDNRDTGTLSLLIDPLMRSLRSDPRYKGMLEKIGLPTSL